MTGREIVSQIRSMNKLLSSDNTVNDRTILKESRDVAVMLVKQATDKRKLWQSPNLFAILPCLEMEPAPLGECCDYTSPILIAKSIKKLPKIGEGIFGLVIQYVAGADTMKIFTAVTPVRYSNLLKLKAVNPNDVFYWIMNDHLYVSNPDTALVNMAVFPTEDIETSLLIPGVGCKCKTITSDLTLCTNPLDKPFYFPADKLADLKNIVYKSLLSTYFNLPVDKTSDNKDDQSK